LLCSTRVEAVRSVLLELTLVEERFNAVLEALRDGLTVVEVAERYGVSRQSVHGWLRTATRTTTMAVSRRWQPHLRCRHSLPGGWRMGCPPVGWGAGK
jgi:Homeodomain-like domain